MKKSILEVMMNSELIKIGIVVDDLEFYYEEVSDDELCVFSLYSIDNIKYSLIEKLDGLFEFKIEYEGGYQCLDREFRDIESLKYHCVKLCSLLSMIFKLNSIHDHLSNITKVQREINLEKLL